MLCPGFDGFGRNLNALVDILRGGFTVFEFGEEIIVEWQHFYRSGDFKYKQDVLEIFAEAENVELLKS